MVCIVKLLSNVDLYGILTSSLNGLEIFRKNYAVSFQFYIDPFT